MSTTLYMAVSKGLNYNQQCLALIQVVLRERLSLLTAHPYPRSGSDIIVLINTTYLLKPSGYEFRFLRKKVVDSNSRVTTP